MRHKWDLFSDTCLKCKIQKRTRIIFTKYMRRCKKIWEYFVNNEWIMINPTCKE